MPDQIVGRRRREHRLRCERAAFGGDAPDAAVFPIAIGVAKAGLVVADDRVVPIAEVQGAVRAELDIDRAEAAVGRCDERLGVFEAEAGAVLVDGHRPDAVVEVAADDEASLPVAGEMGSADDFAAAHLAAAAGGPDVGGLGGFRVFDHAGHRVDDDRVVAGEFEGFAAIGEDEAPWVLGVGGVAVKPFEAQRARIEPPDAGLVELHDAEGGLDAGVGMQSLAEPEFAARRPGERIDILVVVAGAESAQDDLALVGTPVAVGVAEEEEFGAVAEVTPAAVGERFDAGGNHQAVGEDSRLVTAAVAIGVFEDENLVVRFLARFDLRVDGAADDPEAAAGVESHLDRFDDSVGFGSEEVDLESIGDRERGEFGGRVIAVLRGRGEGNEDGHAREYGGHRGDGRVGRGRTC